jgi:CheY-like chemotaxis protein
LHTPTEAAANEYAVLVVDDEEDVHDITRISLRTLTHNGQKVKILSAQSAAEALKILGANPHIAVVLLDVVMESEHAGLDACVAIRENLRNDLVRILLRTGQPGRAPEEKVVQEYSIDGYLPKAELTSTRLLTMVRISLKAFDELCDLDTRRRSLESVHESVRELREESAWADFQDDNAFEFKGRNSL